MSVGRHLEPFVGASISDWEWTIQNWLTFADDNPPGHVATSPEMRFTVLGQEYVFTYQLTLPQDLGWNQIQTIRLMNMSSREVRIKSHRHMNRTYTLQPGEGCTQAARFSIRFADNGVPIGIVENDALILLDHDFEDDPDFYSLLDNPKDSDFKLICEDKQFPCHKIFLKAKSPVLANAFESSESTDEYKIEAFKPDSVKKMLEFIYSGSVKGEVDEDLLKLADYMHIQGLLKLCGKKLGKSLTKDNIFSRLNLAESATAGAQILKDLAIDFIIENYAELKDDPDWNTMSSRCLRELFDRLHSRLPG